MKDENSLNLAFVLARSNNCKNLAITLLTLFLGQACSIKLIPSELKRKVSREDQQQNSSIAPKEQILPHSETFNFKSKIDNKSSIMIVWESMLIPMQE